MKIGWNRNGPKVCKDQENLWLNLDLLLAEHKKHSKNSVSLPTKNSSREQSYIVPSSDCARLLQGNAKFNEISLLKVDDLVRPKKK